MSGFSPEWLALRESADLAARNRDVLAACSRAFADRESIRICDIGAGTGASVRALADILPPVQYWTLVDSDTRNLAAAHDQLALWGDEAQFHDAGLTIQKGARKIVVNTRTCDLAATPACWPADTDLVTASALFDLTSARWLNSFVGLLAIRKTPLLSMLTFDGKISTDPPHELNGAIAEAFCTHQQSDKGFGPAAGPRAPDVLETALMGAGYEIETGESPWLIDNSASGLIHATLAGIASAVQEMQTIPSEGIELWLRSARAARLLTIGHRDVFARAAR